MVEYWNQIPLFQISCKQDYPHDNLTELCDSFKSLIQERLNKDGRLLNLLNMMFASSKSVIYLASHIIRRKLCFWLLAHHVWLFPATESCYRHIKPEVTLAWESPPWGSCGAEHQELSLLHDSAQFSSLMWRYLKPTFRLMI